MLLRYCDQNSKARFRPFNTFSSSQSSSISIHEKLIQTNRNFFWKQINVKERRKLMNRVMFLWWRGGAVDDNISFIVIVCNMHVALWFEFFLPWVKKPILHMEATFRITTYGIKIKQINYLNIVLSWVWFYWMMGIGAWINVLQSS